MQSDCAHRVVVNGEKKLRCYSILREKVSADILFVDNQRRKGKAAFVATHLLFWFAALQRSILADGDDNGQSSRQKNDKQQLIIISLSTK